MSASPGARMYRRDFVRLAAAGAGLATVPQRAFAQQPKRGGVLRHVGFDPPTFDIHGSVSYQTQMVSSFVNRTLFKLVNGAKYGPSDVGLV
jgi:DNA-binding transcriptional LysR family regulator